MKPKILLIDTSALCHAAKYSLGKCKLSNDEEYTFVIYGFLSSLYFHTKKFRQDLTVFATDSKKSKRKKLYSEYKSKRQEKTDEQKALDALAYPQFKKIEKKVLPRIGYRNIFKAKGLEADDIIAQICLDYHDSEIRIVTRDNDIWQCMTKNVSIIDPSNHRVLTDELFREEYGIDPKQWGEVKKIAGCNGDDVQGIERVGNPTAIKYIKGELPKYTKAGNMTKVYKNIKEGTDIIKRNEKLVVLPFKNTPSYILRPDHLSLDAFKKICKKYKFKSIKSIQDQWASVLRLS